YPAPNVPSVRMEGVRGVVDREGRFMGASATLSQVKGDTSVIDIDAPNVDLVSNAEVLAVPVDYRGLRRWGRVVSKSIYEVGTPIPLHGAWDGSTFRTPELRRGAYVIALRAKPKAPFMADSGNVLFFAGPIIERQ